MPKILDAATLAELNDGRHPDTPFGATRYDNWPIWTGRGRGPDVAGAGADAGGWSLWGQTPDADADLLTAAAANLYPGQFAEGDRQQLGDLIGQYLNSLPREDQPAGGGPISSAIPRDAGVQPGAVDITKPQPQITDPGSGDTVTLATGDTRVRNIPGMERLNSEIADLVREGKSEEFIRGHIKDAGIDPELVTGLDDAVKFRSDHPDYMGSFPVHSGYETVPLTTHETLAQWLGGNGAPGAYFTSAGNALTFGQLPQLTGDPGTTRALMKVVNDANPVAAFAGQVVGSSLQSSLTGGALGLIRGPAWLTRGLASPYTADAITGGINGAVNADPGNLLWGTGEGLIESMVGGKAGRDAAGGVRAGIETVGSLIPPSRSLQYLADMKPVKMLFDTGEALAGGAVTEGFNGYVAGDNLPRNPPPTPATAPAAATPPMPSPSTNGAWQQSQRGRDRAAVRDNIRFDQYSATPGHTRFDQYSATPASGHAMAYGRTGKAVSPDQSLFDLRRATPDMLPWQISVGKEAGRMRGDGLIARGAGAQGQWRAQALSDPAGAPLYSDMVPPLLRQLALTRPDLVPNIEVPSHASPRRHGMFGNRALLGELGTSLRP